MKDKQIQCPHCGNPKTNEISWSNNYCLGCGIEFNRKTNKAFTIQYNGSLVPYYENDLLEWC